MGKTCKVIVLGQGSVGKTAVLEQLIEDKHETGTATIPTIEDIYVAFIDTDRGVKEKVRIYDTAGVDPIRTEIPRHYMSFADGYVLVYDVTKYDSFLCMDKLKKEIDKLKEKKDAVIISIGNKCDLKDSRKVEFSTANKWAQKEKVRLWEVSVVNRQSLIDPFVWLTSKMTTPPNKSTFLPMRMVTKGKNSTSDN